MVGRGLVDHLLVKHDQRLGMWSDTVEPPIEETLIGVINNVFAQKRAFSSQFSTWQVKLKLLVWQFGSHYFKA